MRVFCDTNIFVEYLERRQYAEWIGQIFEQEDCEFVTSSSSIYTLSYLLDMSLRKKSIFNPSKNKIVRSVLRQLLTKVKIVDIDNRAFDLALGCEYFSDIEDSFQYQCALKCKADVLLTINDKDFKGTEIKIVTPQGFLGM